MLQSGAIFRGVRREGLRSADYADERRWDTHSHEDRANEGCAFAFDTSAVHNSASMSEKNPLYFGDNLDVLRRYVADESVDLVYLDPPFNSNATYNVGLL